MAHPQSQKGIAPIVLLIVVFAGLAVAGAIYRFNKVNNTGAASETELQNLASPSASVAIPSDWQTYTNKVKHYTVKVPADWKIMEWGTSERRKLNLTKSGDVIFIPPSQIDFTDSDATVIRISTTPSNTEDHLKVEWSTGEKFDETRRKPISEKEGGNIVWKSENLQVAGLPAIRLTADYSSRESYHYIRLYTWLRKNNENYYIDFGNGTKVVRENMDVYNGVVSSFQFTDHASE